MQKFAPVGAPPGAPGLAYQAVRAKGSAFGSPERESGDVHVLPDTAVSREARSLGIKQAASVSNLSNQE